MNAYHAQRGSISYDQRWNNTAALTMVGFCIIMRGANIKLALVDTPNQLLKAGVKPWHLVGAADAEPAPAGRVSLVTDARRTRRFRPGRQVTRNQAEQAGLAGAVRPHDPHCVPGSDRERQVFGDDDPAEPFRHVVQFKQSSVIRLLVGRLERAGEGYVRHQRIVDDLH